MSTLAQRRAARKVYQRVVKTSRLGVGKRFAALKKIAELGGAKNPAAVAAIVGRKKYGKRQMTRWAIAGRKRRR